jgi:hypothetical protein
MGGAVLVIWGFLMLLHPASVWSAPVWNFETVAEVPAPAVPSNCSSPDIRLTGLDFDALNQAVVGWAEKVDCTPGNPLTLVPRWNRRTSGVWLSPNTLLDPNNTPSDLRGIPALVVSPLGTPFYVYAGNGDGTTASSDTGSIFIWRVNLDADPDGPGIYSSPTDLVGADSACETYPFLAADFTSSSPLSWVRGVACGGPIKLNGASDIATSALISDVDYAAGSAAGQHHVVYRDNSAGTVFYSDGVSPVSVISAPAPGGLGLAVNGTNIPHLAIAGYDDPATVGVTEDMLLYLTTIDGGANWTQTAVDATNGVRNPSIALDGTGHPCIAYWSPASSGQIRFACEATGWVSEQVQVAAPASSLFGLPTQTRLAFDNGSPSPKPYILTDRATSNPSNPSGLELLLISTTDAPPVMTTPLDQTNNEGDAVFLHVAASDPDPGDALEYAAIGLPPGLSIGLTSGNIIGTLPFDAHKTTPYAVTVFVSDGILSDSKSFNWTVNNVNRAPEITTPTDQTSTEGVTIAPLEISVIDLDSDVLTYSAIGLPPGFSINTGNGFISGTAPFTVADANTPSVVHTVTVTVTDNGTPSTLSDEVTFNWTINNTNGPPEVTSPGNQITPENTLLFPSLQIVATDPDPNTTLIYSATGLPSGLSISTSTGLITGTPTFSAAAGSPYTVTVSASDGSLSVSQQFTWTVPNVNQPPIMTNPGTQTNDEGSTIPPLDLGTDSSDPDGTALTFDALGLPPGLDINATTGVITGTLPFDAAGSYTVTVSASDGALSDSETFTWVVNNTNGPPEVLNPGPQTACENVPFFLTITASDPDIGESLTLIYSVSGLPASGSLTIDSTGVIGGTPTFTDAGAYTVTVTATDTATAETLQIFVLTICNTNQPPVWDTIPNQSSDEGTTDSLGTLPSVSDADGNELVFSADNLPPGFSINTSTGLITGTAPFTAAGDYFVTVHVTDGLSPPVDQSFTWTIVNINAPPAITQPSDQSTQEGASVSLQIVATDPDPGTTFTFSSTTLPTGLNISSGGLVTGTPTELGTFSVTIIVSDGVGGSDTATFTWVVSATPNSVPVFAVFSIPSTQEGSTPALDIDATDANGDALTFGASGLPPGFVINPSTGMITTTGVPFTAAGSYLVTFTVSDLDPLEAIKSTATQTLTWTVSNVNRTPEVTSPGEQATVENGENESVSLPVVASDLDTTEPNTSDLNFIDTLTYSATGLPPGLTINTATGEISGVVSFDATTDPAQTYSVTVSATDLSGVSDGNTFNWVIAQTNRPPVFDPSLCSLIPVSSEGSGGVNVLILTVVATDPDQELLTYSAVNLPPDFVISPSGQVTGLLNFTSAGTYEVRFTVSDGTQDGTVSQTCSWTVTNSNRIPTLTGPLSQTFFEGEAIFLPFVGSDLDIGDTLTYSSTTTSTLGTLDLILNPTTGAVTGTIPYDASLPDSAPGGKSYTISVRVKDNGNLSSSVVSVTLTILNTNRPPSLVDQTTGGVVTVLENVSFSIAPFGASDPDVPDTGDALTFSMSGQPSWVTGIDPTSGIISGLPPFTSAGDYSITICVTDSSFAQVCAPFILRVINNNRQPDFNASDITDGVTGLTIGQDSNDISGSPVNLEDDSILFLVTPSDPDTPDQGDTFTYGATNLPPGISINPTNGRITGVLALDAAGSSGSIQYAVVVTVCDNGGLCRSQSFTWTVGANRPCDELKLCHVAVLRANGRRVPIRIRSLRTGSTVLIDQVTQDEPVTKSPQSDPEDFTTSDGGGARTSRAWILAERDSEGNGRVYTISFTLILGTGDGRKYKCTKTVSVPNSLGQMTNDGPLFDSNTGTQLTP